MIFFLSSSLCSPRYSLSLPIFTRIFLKKDQQEVELLKPGLDARFTALPLAGASTQASLVSGVIANAVVAENTSGSSGRWQSLQMICVQLYWLDLSFCPEICFQCADSTLKCKGVARHGAENMWGTSYMNASNESKRTNENKCFLKGLALFLARISTFDKVPKPGFSLLSPCEARFQRGPWILCRPWDDIHPEFSLRWCNSRYMIGVTVDCTWSGPLYSLRSFFHAMEP